MPQTRPRLIATTFLALALVLPAGRADAQRPLFSTATDLVVLHVGVKDRAGAYVTGLTEAAFTVLESGRPQAISVFTSEDAPVTVGLLVDNSGSMHPNRARVVAAAVAFAESGHPQDELFALTFDEDVRPALPADAPFTQSIPILHDALAHALHAYGRTALFDAISGGLDYLDRGRHERKVLVVVSDGADNASRATFQDVLAKTYASNALVYAVALADPTAPANDPKQLKQIAEASGGEAFAPRAAGDIAGVLRHIARDIRHAYTIGYVSNDPLPDGAFRKLRVIVQPSGRSRPLAVRTRDGYIATKAAERDDEW